MYYFKYVLKRLLLGLVTFAIIVTISYVLIKLLPSRPIEQFGKDMEVILRRRVLLHQMYVDEMGVYRDTPILEQYVYFLRYAFKGDFGVSEFIAPGIDVWTIFAEKFPYSIAVNFYSIILSIPFGIALGILAAVKKNTWIDHFISTGVMVFVSIPSFVFAVLLQYLLCFRWKIFAPLMIATNGPFSWLGFSTMIPAALCLSFYSIAGFARTTRAELTEVLTGEYMLLARTKGLTRTQATIRHALKNSMVVIFPMILGEFIGILGGSMIIEQIFGIPGIGKLYLTSIQATPPDYNVFVLVTVFYEFISIFTGIIGDLVYGIVDPRIRMGAR